MEADKLRAIRYRAMEKARQNGYNEEWAEDFAQDTCARLAQGRSASIGQLFVDYIRFTQGDSRTGNENAREHSLLADPLFIDELAAPSASDTASDFLNYLNLLDGTDRVIVALKYGWDLTELEIGKVIGVTEGRVSQKLKEIKVRLRKRIMRAEPGNS